MGGEELNSSTFLGGVTQLTELLLHYAAGPGCQTLRCNIPRYGPQDRGFGTGGDVGDWDVPLGSGMGGGEDVRVVCIYIINSAVEYVFIYIHSIHSIHI